MDDDDDDDDGDDGDGDDDDDGDDGDGDDDSDSKHDVNASDNSTVKFCVQCRGLFIYAELLLTANQIKLKVILQYAPLLSNVVRCCQFGK